MAYVDWLVQIAPAWLQRTWGTRYLKSLGLGLDAFTEAGKAAVKARFPVGAPADAQASLGSEAGLPRFEALNHELDGAYGPRLQRKWADLALARTKTGLVNLLAQFGATGTPPWTTQVFDQKDWNAWYPWSWVWILIQPPHPWTSDGNWGDPQPWGDGGTWSSSATAVQVANLRAVIKPWLGSHNRGFLVINTSGGVWGDGGNWGAPDVWGGTAAKIPI